MKKEYDLTNAKRGAVVTQKGKTRITIYIDNDILEEFRIRADSEGYGYQTMINDVLRQYIGEGEKMLNEKILRQVVREELERVSH
ncbi:MAG TPA: CopG family transcriptional regulator [Nitrospiraceae bacterium]|nr:CopG family transcriptional regulator [Nitrospiraceae bacterium]